MIMFLSIGFWDLFLMCNFKLLGFSCIICSHCSNIVAYMVVTIYRVNMRWKEEVNGHVSLTVGVWVGNRAWCNPMGGSHVVENRRWKSGYTQFVSVMIFDIVGIFDCSSGFPEIWGWY